MRITRDITHTGDGGPIRVRMDDTDPAQTAADILARRMYGPAGYCRVLRLDSWTADGDRYTYDAFLGVRSGPGTTVGRNVWIYV